MDNDAYIPVASSPLIVRGMGEPGFQLIMLVMPNSG